MTRRRELFDAESSRYAWIYGSGALHIDADKYHAENACRGAVPGGGAVQEFALGIVYVSHQTAALAVFRLPSSDDRETLLAALRAWATSQGWDLETRDLLSNDSTSWPLD
jgi:hypothetical protein